MNSKISIIITSILKPTEAVKKISDKIIKLVNWNLIIVADLKSPKKYNIKKIKYLSIKKQKSSSFKLTKMLPFNSYSRKNIGYLEAIKDNSNVIIETDDDNLPYSNFFNKPELYIKSKILKSKKWINVYKLFSDQFLWPRGLPLNEINNKQRILKKKERRLYTSPIQQSLSDHDPDVDAIYRLIYDKKIKFKKNLQFVLDKDNFCPFNSQNTVWFKIAFPLLYLPSTCSFRMTDIWRSFIAQRIMHENGWRLSFKSPSVYQNRNVHNLMDNFIDEIEGYKRNNEFIDIIRNLKLKKGIKNINKNFLFLYKNLTQKKFFTKEELILVQAWIYDIEKIL